MYLFDHCFDLCHSETRAKQMTMAVRSGRMGSNDDEMHANQGYKQKEKMSWEVTKKMKNWKITKKTHEHSLTQTKVKTVNISANVSRRL